MARRDPHYRGSYDRRSREIVAAAKANPLTQCWRCGKTLEQHAPHRNGKRPWWTAGHVIDGQVDGTLMPESSTCNFRAGSALARGIPQPARTTRQW